MSLDKDSNEEWLHSKLQLWKRSGYDVDIIEEKIVNSPKDGVEIISKYDSLFERGETVRNRMRDLPRNLEMKRHSLIEKLRNLDYVPDVENTVTKLLEEFRPWILIVEKNISGWKMHGELKKLNELVGRLNNLDPSMIVDAKSIAQYFVDPRMKERIEKEIVEIEVRQNERAKVLGEMEELLSSEGFEIKELGNLNLEARFEEISNVQAEQKKHMMLKQKINQGIRIFDSELARDFEDRRVQLLNSENHENFVQLSGEVDEGAKVFFSRLDNINKKIRHWREMGIEFENMGSISAEELYEWEDTITEKQERVDLLLELRERLIKQNEIWGDEIDSALLGIRRLDLIDKLRDAVESLENKTNLMNIEFDGFIDEWKSRGYNMQKWMGRYTRKPREVLAELKAFTPVLEEGEILRNRIELLDEEMLSQSRRIEMNAMLEDSELELEHLVELEKEVRILENRQKNYRRKLELEWELLVSKNPDLRSVDTTQWDISEFERCISKGLNDNFEEFSTSKSRVILSIQKSLEDEFSMMERQGWDMSGLHSILEKSPEKLGDLLPSIRIQISQYDRLISRLKALPWGRKPDKAKIIMSQLKMPEKLPEIWEMVPSLIRELSTLETVDMDFEFLPWRPSNIKVGPIMLNKEVDDAAPILNVENIVSKEEVIEVKVKENGKTKNIDLQFWKKYSEDLELFANTVGINLDIWPITNNENITLWRRALAENVGDTPRDTRVDRMLRLALRCLPLEDDEDVSLEGYAHLIKYLIKSAEQVHKWTKARLDYRNNIGGGSLLEDTKKLGSILERIPGPGVNLPLEKDEYLLPQSDNIDALKNECESLLKICFVA